MSTQLNLDNIAAKRPRVHGIGLVKAVLSGDTIVVVGSANAGTPVEKRLVLSGIQTPRLGLPKAAKAGENVEQDEPYAYAAREFLRERVLGQIVNFVLPNVNPETVAQHEKALDFAEVTLGVVNLSELMVKNGFAKINLPKPKEDKSNPEAPKKVAPVTATAIKMEDLSPEKQEMYKLQLQAQASKLGMWAGNDAKQVRSYVPVDQAYNTELWHKYQQKELSANVSYVISGSLYRMEIKNPFATKDTPLSHALIAVQLAGVDAPQSGSKTSPAAAFGDEARKYVADRLQGQEVKVVLQAIDANNGQLYGTIVYPKGNISLKLLQDGYAKYAPWSALATTNNTELKFAAAQAKNNLAKDTPYAETPRVAYEATVTQIISGTTLMIKLADGTDKRVQLASIKAPKMLYKEKAKTEPFAFEAIEFLRRSLINKKVNIQLEFVQEPKEKEGEEKKQEPRDHVSMFKGKYNIATELLANGLAEVMSAPRSENGSLYFAELSAAQLKAQKEKKHKWGNGPHIKIDDLTARAPVTKKADGKVAMTPTDIKLNELFTKVNGSALTGIFDTVFAPGRIRVIIPSLNVAVAIKLAAINTPYLDKEEVTDAEEVKVQEAINKELNDKIMAYLKQFVQQDVTIEVTAKQGSSLLGNIIIKDNANKENLAVSLLNHGFVTVNSAVVERNKHGKQLQNAQDYARKSKLGLWVNFDEQKAKEEQERKRAEQASQVGVGIYSKDGDNYINVTVTDVNDPVHFYVNCTDDKNVQLVAEALEKIDAATPVKEDWVPRDDEIVAGLFKEDNKWYRVRVEKASKTKGNHKVQFIDFGNYDVIAHSNVRPLPVDLAKIRPLAKPAALTACSAPLTDSDYFEIAANALLNLTAGKTFAARIDNTQRNGVLDLTLTSEGAEKSINEEMLAAGVVLLNQHVHSSLAKVVAQFTPIDEEARFNHRGVYEHGDYTLDTFDDSY